MEQHLSIKELIIRWGEVPLISASTTKTRSDLMSHTKCNEKVIPSCYSNSHSLQMSRTINITRSRTELMARTRSTCTSRHSGVQCPQKVMQTNGTGFSSGFRRPARTWSYFYDLTDYGNVHRTVAVIHFNPLHHPIMVVQNGHFSLLKSSWIFMARRFIVSILSHNDWIVSHLYPPTTTTDR